ncbi:MAG: hypothetical protein WCP20_15720 [Desulfuromonadales bacterium]
MPKWKDQKKKYKGIEIQKDTPKEIVEILVKNQKFFPFHYYGIICWILAIGCVFLKFEQGKIVVSLLEFGKITGGISAFLIFVGGYLFFLQYKQTTIKTNK